MSIQLSRSVHDANICFAQWFFELSQEDNALILNHITVQHGIDVADCGSVRDNIYIYKRSA